MIFKKSSKKKERWLETIFVPPVISNFHVQNTFWIFSSLPYCFWKKKLTATTLIQWNTKRLIALDDKTNKANMAQSTEYIPLFSYSPISLFEQVEKKAKQILLQKLLLLFQTHP